MASTASSSTTSVARPAIDQELRQRIAGQLGDRFNGGLIGPDHAGYSRARSVWDAMIDKRPGAAAVSALAAA